MNKVLGTASSNSVHVHQDRPNQRQLRLDCHVPYPSGVIKTHLKQFLSVDRTGPRGSNEDISGLEARHRDKEVLR
ncbi:hypothetical protein GWI33_013946 [Rhynchophorus ferrugineus]|uniref:Uncharacterized protein n=1 Tax=Rhynchophorus ferrugineus TaxID=354439 RepID=A0A834MCT5_RHYFE|nr:hypothetical protein GWI33_013946 [Rhynchophorus ferrugineus]